MPTIPDLPGYLPSLLGGALVAALLLPLTHRRQRTPGFRPFLLLLGAMLLWCLAGYAEGVSTTLAGKVAWGRLRYLAIALLPPLWLWFAAGFTRRGPHPAVAAALLLPPAITCALLFGLGDRALVWAAIEAPSSPSGHLVIDHGPWFWGGVLAYGVLAVMVADVLLLGALPVNDDTVRPRILALVVASLLPLALYLLHLGRWGPLAEIDATPVGLGLAATVFAWSLHGQRLFDPTPTAFRRVMETIPDLLMVVGADGRITFANDAALRLLDRQGSPSEGDELVGEDIADVWPGWRGLAASARDGQPAVVELHSEHGRPRELEVRVLPLAPDARATSRILLGQDISERRAFERRIEEMAFNDPLTGLPNRRSLLEFARKVLSMSRRGQNEAALVFLDLQRFKEINDALGHSVGDSVLQQVSRRLQEVTRTENMLARLGGDEFAAILQNCNRAGAMGAAQRMLEALDDPFEIGGTSLHVSATAGIALYPDHGVDVSDLLRHADMAMYQARRHGRPAAAFDPDDPLFTAEHLRLEADLRSALSDGGLYLEYQPIVDARDGRTVAVEALLRWHHPERGLLMPDEFLPIARRRALTGALDRFALERALTELAPHTVDIAVNMAGSTLVEDGLAEFVEARLHDSGVEARRLIVEITETELVLPERARPVIDRIRALGVRIATDDFGSGFSSLTYLRTLPLDVVKVDRSLVEAIGRGAEDEAVLAAILRVANSLDLAVVAEGVERIDQRAWLTDHTCGLLQGFLFARPSKLEQLSLELRSPNPATDESGARR